MEGKSAPVFHAFSTAFQRQRRFFGFKSRFGSPFDAHFLHEPALESLSLCQRRIQATRWNFNEQILTKFQHRVSCLCAQSALPPFQPGWMRDVSMESRERRRMQFSFTSLLFHSNRPRSRAEFLKIALKLIHFFTVFVHSSNFHRGGVWVKALEKLWNQVKLHILPPRRTKKRSFQGRKVPEKQKTIYKPCEDFACLRVRDNEWEGRHMWVHRRHPAKRVPFCLTLYLRALQELACLEAFFICVFFQGALRARGVGVESFRGIFVDRPVTWLH